MTYEVGDLVQIDTRLDGREEPNWAYAVIIDTSKKQLHIKMFGKYEYIRQEFWIGKDTFHLNPHYRKPKK
tara:strand:+ start:3506 stop:3715 length:210 start_codon:yes stop_codon:yes gene_type:complete